METPFEEPFADIEKFVEQSKMKDAEINHLKKELAERDEKILSLEEKANQRYQQLVSLAKERNALQDKVRQLETSTVKKDVPKPIMTSSYVQCEKSALIPYLEQMFEYKKLVEELRELLTTEKEKFDPFLYLCKMENKIDDYIVLKQTCEQTIAKIREDCAAEIAKIRAEYDDENKKQKITIEKFRSILRRCSSDLSERSKTPVEEKTTEAHDDLCGLAHSSFS
jgi:hypothetical protein